MFEKVEGRPELVKGEHQVLALWRESDAFKKLRKKLEGKPRWSFLDGPITANNPMGVHHAWGRTYKDLFQRYYAMKGFDQRWQNGFDCQGLWVEVQVERELGFNSKRDIEQFGLEEFVERCKQRVLKYAAIQTEQSIRLGMWMDWDNSYFTMSDENNYTIWTFLKRCHERGLIYKDLDSMPWCPRCGTGISEQERKEGYREIEDDAVFLEFPLREREGSLLVWTTTPWTLAANVAAAVNPEITYVKVQQRDKIIYVAKSRLAVLQSQSSSKGEPQILEELTGAQMVGWTYDGPFDDLQAAAVAVPVHRVIAFDQVTETEGTGIVHIAPGCGKEDFDLSKVEALPVIAPIDDSGIYVEGFGPLAGKFAGDVTDEVFSALKDKGLFYSQERYLHDYPHCWRCNTKLLFRAVDEWFIDMSWRDEIKETVRKIRWIPEHGQAQELDWLNNMSDWMISKKRYWGLALPIWECASCGWFDVVGGRDELKERAASGWDEFEGHSPHRPWVDSVKIDCPECGSTASRIEDVGNPWLDAGIVPYSTVRYNDDREYWSAWVPADLVVECFPGQFRNWFYALLAMSTMMEGIEPFKTLFGYALVKDEKGEEMHKSRGNSIEFNEAADRVSADVMRWLYCRQTPTQNLNFGYSVLEQVSRKTFGTLWNTYLFFVNYALLDEFDPMAPKLPIDARPEIDRWILSDLQELISLADRSYSDFWVAPFVRRAEEFIDQLSNWYVRRNRQRFWNPKGTNEQDKMAAYQTLYEVLVTLSKLLAPVVPFLTERLYQNLVVRVDPNAPESVHHCDFPVPDDALLDESLSRAMRLAQQVAATGHSLREKAEQRVRQPLREMRVGASDPSVRESVSRMRNLIVEELNIKSLEVLEDLGDLTKVNARPNFAKLGPRFGSSVQEAAAAIESLPPEDVRTLNSGGTISIVIAGMEHEVSPQDVQLRSETAEGWAVADAGPLHVALDTRLDEPLVKEGLARDVVRHLNNLRKSQGLEISDRISVEYEARDELLAAAIVEWRDYIANEVQADVLQGQLSGEAQTVATLDGRDLSLSIERVS